MESLESRVAVLDERWRNTQEAVSDLHESVTELNKNLNKLTNTINKYQGAGLSLLLVIPAIWSAISLALSLWIKR